MIIRWLIGFFTAYAILLIIACGIQGLDVMRNEQLAVLDSALGYQTVSASDPTGGSFSGLTMLPTTVGALWDALLFRFSFFDANFVTKLIQIIVFRGCVIGMIFTLALFIRQVISGK